MSRAVCSSWALGRPPAVMLVDSGCRLRVACERVGVRFVGGTVPWPEDLTVWDGGARKCSGADPGCAAGRACAVELEGVPGASSCPRADPRGSRAPRPSGQHPRKPRSSPGHQRQAGLPHHRCESISFMCSMCVVRVPMRGRPSVGCGRVEAVALVETYGCSSTKLVQS